ncbi:fibroblast growth factor 23-like [Stegastes partitus]|uniref:Fibroblast growth factor 23-like n=1 Tax=Stegastes partitus TaxID=144197 RepID=A0A9Y4NW20_9TELE|nr:PREDICTED: fibroblast growth factor 23-like [Stegastes partitus]
MQPAFFPLILIAVHVCVPVDCRPKLPDQEQHQEGSLSTGTHTGTSGRVHLELNRSMRHVIHRDFLVIFPVRTDTSSSVSIFDLRRRRFLCMDSTGELFNSRQKDREDCLFQRVWFDLADQHDLFYSTGGNRLLRLVGSQSHWEPPEPSSALTKRRPSTRRQRRSEEVNPSDPLRSESHPPHSAKDPKDADHSQPEQDRAGAVSKETITSCDDPLRVLQSKGAVSPVKANIADRADQD